MNGRMNGFVIARVGKVGRHQPHKEVPFLIRNFLIRVNSFHVHVCLSIVILLSGSGWLVFVS